MTKGFDVGTYNLVCSERDQDKKIQYRREINAFLEMPIENRFTFNMMRSAGVPLIERPDIGVAYALGEAAVNIAYSMSQVELKRPMRDGCVNPTEKNAQQILNVMIQSLLGELKEDLETVYFSVPANAINEETDSDYHAKVLEAILKSFRDEKGFRVDPHPINEALAIIYAEAAMNQYTGIGCSFGSGMVNVCYAVLGVEAFKFSVVNSGDWIDKMAAKATGESIAYINKEKEKIDLTVENYDSLVMRAIKSQYEIMIQKTVNEIKKGLDNVGNKARSADPVNVILAGGTSLPTGFDALFEKYIRAVNLPISIGKVIRPAEPLYSVARGCLLAAEASKA